MTTEAPAEPGTAVASTATPAAEVKERPTMPHSTTDPGSETPRKLLTFELMDRLDDMLLLREMEGIAATDLMYVIKGDDGKDQEALSKAGVDECCVRLARSGEAIREEEVHVVMDGIGFDQVALVQAKATRYALSNTGVEVRLDSNFGFKRQPLYDKADQEMSLDVGCPGKKPRIETVKGGKMVWYRRTWREMLTDDPKYLQWIADNFKEEHIRNFAAAVLAWNGEKETEPRIKTDPRYNPFWYEQGCMKACRNAKIRMIPMLMRAEVIGIAKKSGLARRVDETGENVPADPPPTDTPKPVYEPLTRDSAPLPGNLANIPIKAWPWKVLEWAADPERHFADAEFTKLVNQAARKEMDGREDGSLTEEPRQKPAST